MSHGVLPQLSRPSTTMTMVKTTITATTRLMIEAKRELMVVTLLVMGVMSRASHINKASQGCGSLIGRDPPVNHGHDGEVGCDPKSKLCFN